MRLTITGSRRLAALLLFPPVLLGAAALYVLHYRSVVVVGESMCPTFHTGDLLLVARKAYNDARPMRGEIVVCRQRAGLVVKRIVGLPGELVEVRNGSLFVDERRASEPYTVTPGNITIDPGRLFPGKFAILGDKRMISETQPTFGIVAREEILGKVVLRIPLSSLVRWSDHHPCRYDSSQRSIQR